MGAAFANLPWRVDHDPRRGMEWNNHILDSKGLAICFMAHSDGKDLDGDNAKAVLLAAAPELHELLGTLTEWARQVAAREDVPRGIRSAAAGLADDGKRLLAKATTP